MWGSFLIAAVRRVAVSPSRIGPGRSRPDLAGLADRGGELQERAARAAEAAAEAAEQDAAAGSSGCSTCRAWSPATSRSTGQVGGRTASRLGTRACSRPRADRAAGAPRTRPRNWPCPLRALHSVRQRAVARTHARSSAMPGLSILELTVLPKLRCMSSLARAGSARHREPLVLGGTSGEGRHGRIPAQRAFTATASNGEAAWHRVRVRPPHRLCALCNSLSCVTPEPASALIVRLRVMVEPSTWKRWPPRRSWSPRGPACSQASSFYSRPRTT